MTPPPTGATPRVHVDVQVMPHDDYRTLRRVWLEAEELGADAIFGADHFVDPYLGRRGKNFECWTLLAAMAVHTERVEIGPLVTGSSFRNPNLVADMARTVDHVSDGRLILGMGAGWFERDFTEYGFEWGTRQSRGERLAADVATIAQRLDKLNPPPVRPIPMLVGGVGEKITLKVVAEHADIWHGSGNPETYRHKASVLERWCAELGRDPADIQRAVFINQPHELDPDEYLALGVTRFGVLLTGPDYDLAPLREAIAWRDAIRRNLAQTGSSGTSADA
jgi:probable F420-dependent oxidoreductase